MIDIQKHPEEKQTASHAVTKQTYNTDSRNQFYYINRSPLSNQHSTTRWILLPSIQIQVLE
jgi:hypothetical protein